MAELPASPMTGSHLAALGAFAADPAAWGALAIAATLGAMVFFNACVAPLVLLRLEAAIAARLIRALWPCYHGFGALTSGLAAVLCLGQAPRAATLAALACLGFLFARQVLMPAIDAARDAAISDAVAARGFTRLQRAGVAIQLLQAGLLAVAFAFALQRG